MDLNPSNVRDNHKHVGSNLELCLEHISKAKLTMNDLMTTKNKELFVKIKWITYLSSNDDQNKIGLNLDEANC